MDKPTAVHRHLVDALDAVPHKESNPASPVAGNPACGIVGAVFPVDEQESTPTSDVAVLET